MPTSAMSSSLEGSEASPLLPRNEHENSNDAPCCWPRDARRRAVQENLYNTCRVPCLYAPVPRNSPVVMDYCQRILDKKKRREADEHDAQNFFDGRTKLQDHDGTNLLSSAQDIEKGRGLWQQSVGKDVLTIYVLAFCTMAMMTMISPTLLLYLQHMSMSSSSDIHFYVVVSVIGSSAPVFCHTLVSHLADWVGAGTAMAFSNAVVGLGLLCMVVSQSSKVFFAIAYTMYSLAQSMRTIRTLILSHIVPSEQRTELMSYHALMTPLGALLGPVIWLVIERYSGDWQVRALFHVDRFTVNFAVAALIAFFMAAVAGLRLPDVRASSQRFAEVAEGSQIASDRHTVGGSVVHVQMRDGQEYDVDINKFRRRIFVYFCAVMFLVNLSMGLYMVLFQPVMVNIFHATGKTLGYVFEIISVFAIIPPILVAYLSKRLKDRQILLIGMISKLVGISLFLPLFGPVREWQVVVGYILIIKASIFFFTSAMSLFTKLLGNMSSGALLGMLSSLSALGPALAQIFFADRILQDFGSFKVGLFVFPLVIGFVLVLWPWFWTRLDSDREFSSMVRLQYDRLHPRKG